MGKERPEKDLGRSLTRAVRRLDERRTSLIDGGHFAAALLAMEQWLRDDSYLGPDDDTSFWVDVAKRATMQPNIAVFQLYLGGVEPDKLARSMLRFFPAYRAAEDTGGLSDVDKALMEGGLTLRLLEFYPSDYLAHHQKLRGKIERTRSELRKRLSGLMSPNI